jgi:hypothetical protein
MPRNKSKQAQKQEAVIYREIHSTKIPAYEPPEWLTAEEVMVRLNLNKPRLCEAILSGRLMYTQTKKFAPNLPELFNNFDSLIFDVRDVADYLDPEFDPSINNWPGAKKFYGGKDEKKYKTNLGRNIDQLRQDCGWSYNDLEKSTGISKRLIIDHIFGRRQPQPKNLKLYADNFSRQLKRSITVSDLQNSTAIAPV